MNTGYNHIRWKDPRLGRYIPTDWEHVEKYPVKALGARKIVAPYIAMGVDWHRSFNFPVKDKDGRMWIGKNPDNLGPVEGGHAILCPSNHRRNLAWYKYYNQGFYSACCDFCVTQGQSLLNHKRYKLFQLWDIAKADDEWPETNPGDNNGTSINAILRALMNNGLAPVTKNEGIIITPEKKITEGISSFYWAIDEDDMLRVLNNPLYAKLEAVPWFNTWGEDYPPVVWVPLMTIRKLRLNYGEFGIPIDR